jgi:predicted  nucleic acid-binding Zn-ribbon protein
MSEGLPMRVDPAAQLRLLDLQQLDTKLDQLAHRRRTVPQITELATLDQKAAGLRDRDVALRTQISDLEREVARAEADVAQVRERIDRDRGLLTSGSVSSARQLTDLQHEVDSLTRRVSELEDVELGVMERLEQTQERMVVVAQELAEVNRAKDATEVGRDAAFDDIAKEAERVDGERHRVLPDIPADLLALYERIRGASGGIGAAALHRGRCQGCQLMLSPADLGAIRSAPPDEVLRCEECRRILVRTPESGL